MGIEAREGATAMSEQFEEKLLAVLSQETHSQPEGPHLRTRELRRLLRGRMRVGEFDRVGAHLAGCAECRARYDVARRAVADTLPRVDSVFPASRVRLVFLRHLGVAAVVLLITAISIALGGPPQPASSSDLRATSLGRGTSSERPETSRATSSSLDPRSLVRALRAFDGYPPSRAAAYTIGLLRESGVPLSSEALAFRAATILVAEPGDTWESVAANALGDSTLWPMVVLLNMEKTQDGEFVPPGTYLRVPQPLPAEGSQ